MKLATVFGFLAISLLCGCGKKIIQGQIFIKNKSDIETPIQNAAVVLISEKDFTAYLATKKSQLAQDETLCSNNYNQLLTTLIQISNSVYATPHPINDPENSVSYKQASAGLNASIQEFNKMSNAAFVLISKYGLVPDVYTRNYSSEVRTAYKAEEYDESVMERCAYQENQYRSEMNAIKSSFLNYDDIQKASDTDKIIKAQNDLSAANFKLKNLGNADFYLADYDPDSTNFCATDSNGNFTLLAKRSENVLFSKSTDGDSGESFFWAIRIGQDSQKISLSNLNTFNIKDWLE
jgi:hypothetical protein